MVFTLIPIQANEPRRKGEKAKKIDSERFEAKHAEIDELDAEDVIIAQVPLFAALGLA